MNKNIKLLKREFIKISHNGWVESLGRSIYSASLTLERELMTLELGNYNNITIRLIKEARNPIINLFRMRLNNDRLKELNIIINNYELTNSYLFAYRFSCNKETIINNYKLKFNVDKLSRKIYLNIYDLRDNLVVKIFSLSFNELKKYLKSKLNGLVIVTYFCKRKDNKLYYKYGNVESYNLKNFETFIDLLERGAIQIKLGHSGHIKSKILSIDSLIFEIKNKNILLLFDKEY